MMSTPSWGIEIVSQASRRKGFSLASSCCWPKDCVIQIRWIRPNRFGVTQRPIVDSKGTRKFRITTRRACVNWRSARKRTKNGRLQHIAIIYRFINYQSHAKSVSKINTPIRNPNVWYHIRCIFFSDNDKTDIVSHDFFCPSVPHQGKRIDPSFYNENSISMLWHSCPNTPTQWVFDPTHG